MNIWAMNLKIQTSTMNQIPTSKDPKNNYTIHINLRAIYNFLVALDIIGNLSAYHTNSGTSKKCKSRFGTDNSILGFHIVSREEQVA